MAEPTQELPAQPTPTEPSASVAELHGQAAADYAGRTSGAEARNLLAEARIHGNEAAGA
ncbi:hypothetical protein [Streptomyces sp.]|uniref:hypothetical protein n=1 Tax=Streptomyces sp. TaxID=1931 RepID=UPI002D79BF6C|nr:hypothetical protein [Streptomyces sp.]HET6356073.1 hypothetical protein [Streptomyces sp.]